MTEWLAAALAVAGLGGWLWWRQRHSRAHKTDFGGDYFRGLNYLLNEQPDKALEVFLQLAEVNPDTVETHLALGNLFRRRGEVEHAIRCHENIIAKSTISPAERHHALSELAEDYRRAGLLDRAEDLYHQLADDAENRQVALGRLLDIYQQEQDWPQAIEIGERLHAAGDTSRAPLIAHFHCERAAAALRDNQLDEARTALAAAHQWHPESLRWRLLIAQLRLREQHPHEAVQTLRAALHEHPDLLPVALTTLTEAHRATGTLDQLRDELSQWLSERQDVSAALALTRMHQAEGDYAHARELLLQQLTQRPNVHLLATLLEQLDQAEYQQLSPRLRPIIEELCTALLSDEVSYRCRQCGYGGHIHHWQCPGCRHWDTTWPVRGVTGE
ncbi:MAG: lipopolysaccharide assembly protein LapB [Wenzhouxiangellaceae bacterium]